ncbi:MAG: hypothetical protein EKK39_13730 [Sphingobacteriales bacterium]|uniref:hypothetical protein n=1 Tax=Hydrotalea flava TaxID=714549 RepID=UPI00082D050A|nr:hypothetical protein [Hydrotalea flava]RTL47664.1 MAG: hypothetical protein EKK39_13730 [Sphingobacteriales bacterium]
MKLIKYFLLLLISTNTNAQLTKDTLYINRNSNQVVFIDTPHSKYHDLVFKFLLSDLKQNGAAKTNIVNTENISSSYLGDWITVKKFKNKYFAYFPSEPFYNTFFRLSDSVLLINDFNEGFITYRVADIGEKIKKVKIKLIGNEGERYSISIRQKSKKLFIVKSSLFKVKKLYFVKRDNYFDYPIIVNYCPTSRCQEFDFR